MSNEPNSMLIIEGWLGGRRESGGHCLLLQAFHTVSHILTDKLKHGLDEFK